jgi:uncharacterized protein
LDTSAYVKLPLQESEREALLVALGEWDGYVSSALLGVEAIRACGRYGEEYAAEARVFLEGMALLPLDHVVLDEAASIDPADLRSLDALHLATALSIKGEIGLFVTYDERLGAAAA